MKPVRKRSCAKVILWCAGGLAGACLLLLGLSILINRGLPRQSSSIDRLSAADKARLAEVQHLRQSLGGAVLPGWDQADIPLIVYNEQNAILVGLQDPAGGWETFPGGARRGGTWEVVPGDTVFGQPYYRLAYPGPDSSPQNFVVEVGGRPVASVMEMEWFRISLAEQFRSDLPGIIKPFFPYSLVVTQFMPGSDRWATMALHEQAHTYQAIRAGQRLAQAERAGFDLIERYPWESERFKEDWQVELSLLQEGLRAKTDGDARSVAVRFLAQRASRRQAARLPADLVDYERQREWAEGIAKYAEFSIYRLATATPGYAAEASVSGDPEFHAYRQFPQHWNNEVEQVTRMAGDRGDGRFYYTGMAQASLLDRLSPGWKARLFDDGVWLEDLLAEAVR